MRCETFLARYDRLDARSAPSAALRRHLESCPSCRASVERLRNAMATARIDDQKPLPASAAIEDHAMAVIRLMPKPQRELFSTRDWILAGVVIALSMVFIPLGRDFGVFFSVVGTSYTLPLALVLGLAITVYGALFVGTHIDEVTDFVNRKIIRLH